MFEKLKTFMSESFQEFKKVRWPSKDELIGLTIAVVVSSILLLVFVGAVDRLLFLVIQWVMG